MADERHLHRHRARRRRRRCWSGRCGRPSRSPGPRLEQQRWPLPRTRRGALGRAAHRGSAARHEGRGRRPPQGRGPRPGRRGTTGHRAGPVPQDARRAPGRAEPPPRGHHSTGSRPAEERAMQAEQPGRDAGGARARSADERARALEERSRELEERARLFERQAQTRAGRARGDDPAPGAAHRPTRTETIDDAPRAGRAGDDRAARRARGRADAALAHAQGARDAALAGRSSPRAPGGARRDQRRGAHARERLAELARASCPCEVHGAGGPAGRGPSAAEPRSSAPRCSQDELRCQQGRAREPLAPLTARSCRAGSRPRSRRSATTREEFQAELARMEATARRGDGGEGSPVTARGSPAPRTRAAAHRRGRAASWPSATSRFGNAEDEIATSRAEGDAARRRARRSRAPSSRRRVAQLTRRSRTALREADRAPRAARAARPARPRRATSG